MADSESEAYIDAVAQAVIDRIEERSRVSALVEAVVQRVMELQEAVAKTPSTSTDDEGEDKQRGIVASTGTCSE